MKQEGRRSIGVKVYMDIKDNSSLTPLSALTFLHSTYIRRVIIKIYIINKHEGT
jgi:hypothetical protein